MKDIVTEIRDAVNLANFDPGAFTKRGADYKEPLHEWQARAVELALKPIRERSRPLTFSTDEFLLMVADRDQWQAEAERLREENARSAAVIEKLLADQEARATPEAMDALHEAMDGTRWCDKLGQRSAFGCCILPAGHEGNCEPCSF